jgi:hypothetical protein
MNTKMSSRTALSAALLPALLATALLAFGGTLAARQPSPQSSPAPANQDTPPAMDPNMPGMDHMPGMNGAHVPGDTDNHAERGAMMDMSHHHHMMGAHMYMTKLRVATPQDWAKADAIAQQLREAIEKYKDYHVALDEGFKIFAPNLPQPEYHFTSTQNAFLEMFTFDPTRPTSLLYAKTKTGYELIGAMYTMPRRSTEEQLNSRVPLSIAQWHLHTNMCVPAKGQLREADWSKFGLEGSIGTADACSEAGGTFYPVIFGWMVHVYPFEATREKVWGQ